MEAFNAVELTDRLHAEQGRGDPFAAAVRATRMPMIITDPRQPNNPIVFANDAFCGLSGYGRSEVIGRNCRFLQGPDTDPAEVGKLRDAIARRTDTAVEILNYRKDGTPFWNALYLSPVFSEGGELQFFFASQFDVTDRKLRELEALDAKDFFEKAVKERTRELETALEQKTLLLHEVDHRVKNNLQIVAAMIRNQSRHSGGPEVKAALMTTMSRVETLGAVHRRLYQSDDVAQFDVAEFTRDVAGDLVEASGRPELSVRFDLQPVIVPSAVASSLALLINELLTNALKHAFPQNGKPGAISIAMACANGETSIVIEDDGIGMSSTKSDRRTFGHRLIESLVNQVRGTILFEDVRPGTRVTVTFPISQTGRQP